MTHAHLTSVKHLGPKKWAVDCLCGWESGRLETKKAAASEGHQHWLSMPVVTGVWTAGKRLGEEAIGG